MKNKILLFSLVLILISGFPGVSIYAALNVTGQDTLTFIHVSDVHICNLKGYHPEFVQRRQHFGDGMSPFREFLATVPAKVRADMVIVTGDNVDYYEAETESGGMLDTQIEQYVRLIDNSQVPVFLTLGNHDIASYRITPGPWSGNNQLEAGRARATWMRNVPCFKDGTYYSRVFKIDTMTFRFIFLDNGYYSTQEISDGELNFSVDPYQLRWLDAQLKASPSDVEIIFMHIPLPNGKPAENEILTEAMSDYSQKTEVYNLFSVLENNSSTAMIFGGHNHINLINRYKLPNGNLLTQVRTGAFGNDTANWRMIRITKDKILVSRAGSTVTEYTIPLY